MHFEKIFWYETKFIYILSSSRKLECKKMFARPYFVGKNHLMNHGKRSGCKY